MISKQAVKRLEKAFRKSNGSGEEITLEEAISGKWGKFSLTKLLNEANKQEKAEQT